MKDFVAGSRRRLRRADRRRTSHLILSMMAGAGVVALIMMLVPLSVDGR